MEGLATGLVIFYVLIGPVSPSKMDAISLKKKSTDLTCKFRSLVMKHMSMFEGMFYSR